MCKFLCRHKFFFTQVSSEKFGSCWAIVCGLMLISLCVLTPASWALCIPCGLWGIAGLSTLICVPLTWALLVPMSQATGHEGRASLEKFGIDLDLSSSFRNLPSIRRSTRRRKRDPKKRNPRSCHLHVMGQQGLWRMVHLRRSLSR